MGNEWVSGVDPDGRFAFAAVLPILKMAATGAAKGALLGGVVSEDNGGKFWDGAWRGAITGGIGAVGNYYAPIGLLPGLGFGAAAGGIIGGLNAEIGGGDFIEGFKKGAISGGIYGGVSGAIGAVSLGGNFWTGYRPPLADYKIMGQYENAFPKRELEFSDNTINEYRDRYFKNRPRIGGKTTTIGPPSSSGWVLEGNYLKEVATGKLAYGLTASSIWKGGSATSIYLAKAAFHSPETLINVLGHEYGHAQINIVAGIKGYGRTNDNDQHAAIYNWQQNLAYNMKWYKLLESLKRSYREAYFSSDTGSGGAWMSHFLKFLPLKVIL
jgi:hypothetical protein